MRYKIILFITFLFLIANYCYAQHSISSFELINNAKDYDKKKIIFEGEAVGDLMRRGNFYWLNVSQDGNAIGIWLPMVLAVNIRNTGGYNKIGDWVKLEGIFNKACIEHGGDLDIHAIKLTVIRQGRVKKDNVPDSKKQIVLYLGGISLCLLMLQGYLNRQKKKSITA